LIETQIASQGDAPAVRTPDGQVVSYRRMGETIRAFAARGHTQGLKPGDVVVLEVDNFAVTLCLIFALSRLGATIALGDGCDAMMATGFEPDAVITIDLRFAKQPRNIGFNQSWFDKDGNPPLDHWPGLGDGAPCVIGASSGTTGTKKFMPFALDQLEARINEFDQLTGTDPVGRMITLGIGTIWGFCLMVRTLQSGGLIATPVGSPRQSLEVVRDHNIAEIYTVPSVASDLVKAQENNPLVVPSLKRMAIGGGTLSDYLANAAKALLCETVIITYGATEIGHVAVGDIDDLKGTPGAIGFVGAWLEAQAADDAGKPLKPGEVGDIRFKVPEIMSAKRYIAGAQPGEEDVLSDGWFYPGDTGYITKDGLLVLTGRVSDLINTGGNKLAPEIFEHAVTGQFGVLQAGCVGLNNRDGFDDVCIAVMGQRGIDKDALAKHLVDEFGTTTRFRLMEVEQLPHNMGGNLDRAALRQLFAQPT
jgi:acyl-coenzyme A synthetase/AMP-(fatty) acid ligase